MRNKKNPIHFHLSTLKRIILSSFRKARLHRSFKCGQDQRRKCVFKQKLIHVDRKLVVSDFEFVSVVTLLLSG